MCEGDSLVSLSGFLYPEAHSLDGTTPEVVSLGK